MGASFVCEIVHYGVDIHHIFRDRKAEFVREIGEYESRLVQSQIGRTARWKIDCRIVRLDQCRDWYRQPQLI